MAIDPTCGMTVDAKNAAGKQEHNGHTYYFCSQHCVDKFNENPAKFVEAAGVGRAPAAGERGEKGKALPTRSAA